MKATLAPSMLLQSTREISKSWDGKPIPKSWNTSNTHWVISNKILGSPLPHTEKQMSTTQNRAPKHQQFQQDNSIGRPIQSRSIQKHMFSKIKYTINLSTYYISIYYNILHNSIYIYIRICITQKQKNTRITWGPWVPRELEIARCCWGGPPSTLLKC